LGWAAAGGIVLGWILGERKSYLTWSVRSILVIVLLFILFDWSLIESISSIAAESFPRLLFPNSDLGLYGGQLDKHLERTIYTNTQNFLVLLWWTGALITAAIQKDRITLYTGLILGIGFGIGFMQSAVWCLGYGFAPKYIDWWKMWEINSGFNFGIIYAFLMNWSIRKFDEKPKNERSGEIANSNDDPKYIPNQNLITLYIAISGSILIYFMSFEYFFNIGLFLIAFYNSLLIYSSYTRQINKDRSHLPNKRNEILLIFSAFLLLFLLFQGASTNGGRFLELYSEKEIDQYAWPVERVIIFFPFALILVIAAIHIVRRSKIINILNSMWLKTNISKIVINIITLIGFLGALTIWPSKIGVLYAFMIIIAVYSFYLLDRKYEKTEVSQSDQ
jgi:hypothetical protein